jgi:hypothetical protein
MKHLTRARRRDLKRRANKLLDHVGGTVLEFSGSPRTVVLLLCEHSEPVIVSRETIRWLVPILPELGQALDEVERSTEDDGGHIAALVQVDGCLQVAFVAGVTLGRGGDA